MEAMVALAYVNLTAIIQSLVPIHVTKKSAFVEQWLAIAGIRAERIITGTIEADILIVPHGGECGAPAPRQLYWLANLVSQSLALHKYWHRQQQQNSLQRGWRNGGGSILLGKRSTRRALINYMAIELLMQDFARRAGLLLVIHDDTKLPPLKEQLERFARASVLVSPHGAGEVNMVAMRPGSHVIELMDFKNMNTCFARIAHILGLSYDVVATIRYRLDPALLRGALKRLALHP